MVTSPIHINKHPTSDRKSPLRLRRAEAINVKRLPEDSLFALSLSQLNDTAKGLCRNHSRAAPSPIHKNKLITSHHKLPHRPPHAEAIDHQPGLLDAGGWGNGR